MESFSGDNVLIALDLQIMEDSFIQQKAVEAMVKVIVDYNINKKYNVLTCNCQHFVDDVLKALGISPVFTGKLGELMANFQNAEPGTHLESSHDTLSGKELELTWSYIGAKNNINFSSHKELDEECWNQVLR